MNLSAEEANMFRLSGVIVASCTLLFAPIFLAEPLSAQGKSPFQPDVSLAADGGAFEFDGSGPGMDLGRSSVLDVSGVDFTIHAWVKFDSLINDGPCYGTQCDMAIAEEIQGEYNSYGWRLLKWSDGHFWFCLGGGAENGCDPYVSTTAISQTVAMTDVWYSIAGVKKADQISIYVNGVLEGTKVPGEYFDVSDAPFLVGSNRLEHSFLVGQVAQVQLFRSALSWPHVRAMFEQSKKGYGY